MTQNLAPAYLSGTPRPPITDPHRPRFHFTAPRNWLNDPNGLSFRDGVFHLFYQHNPHAPTHASIHWGHATSTDLVHWVDQPIALAPGAPGEPDDDGCWSGVLVDDAGIPTIVYTGLHGDQQRPCIAVGSDDLTTWVKDPGNPVIEPPEGLQLNGFRDHCVWREGNEWHQLIGSGIQGRGGTALLYRSTDLRNWEYLHPILIGDADERDPVWTGTMWECIDLFDLNGRSVLMFSAWDNGHTHYPVYMLGTYREGRFLPKTTIKMDAGEKYFYAPQTTVDADGRRIAFGWAQEGRNETAQIDAGWSGVMSLPRVLAIRPDGVLGQAPASEIQNLRTDHKQLRDLALPRSKPIELTEIIGEQIDLDIRIQTPQPGLVRVAVRCTPDGKERTVITFDTLQGTLSLDRTRSSLDPNVDTVELHGKLRAHRTDGVDLRIIIDHSILEIFADEELALTARIYPTCSDALRVNVESGVEQAIITQLDAWTMADIWTPEPSNAPMSRSGTPSW